LNKIVLILLGLLASRFVYSAPCCGGGANVPGIIGGDDLAQLSLTASNAFTVADALPGKEVRTRSGQDRELLQTLRVDAATLLSDRWQAAVSIPVIRRSRDRKGTFGESTGLGDVSFSVAYEFLPQWSYSRWQPKGIVFADVILPTGKSLYESSAIYRLDSRGRGFWGAGAGVFLVKTWGSWDVFLLTELHRSFGKTVSLDVGSLDLSPGWGGSGTVAIGFSPGSGKWRIGALLAYAREDGVQTTGVVKGSGSAVETLSPGAQLSYLWAPTLSLNVTYTDQTLFAANDNAAVNRTVALLLQKRWER
jgi:hypothetical protein